VLPKERTYENTWLVMDILDCAMFTICTPGSWPVDRGLVLVWVQASASRLGECTRSVISLTVTAKVAGGHAFMSELPWAGCGAALM
jgi:hypothetical protein